MKRKKRYLLLLIPVLFILTIFTILVLRQTWLDVKMNDDYDAMYTEEKYQTAVSVQDFGIIEQKVSCGYACIELFSNWKGKELTEADLLKMNAGKITTSMGSGFEDEMNKQFLEFSTTKLSNLKNTELLNEIYESLEKGVPVPVQFAALDNRGEEKRWTLHYGVIIAMDMREDNITLSNPYGYLETYSIEGFLNSTSFRSYENMEIPFQFGFLVSMFSKNTIYIVEEKE